MAKPRVKAGGGMAALRYVYRKGREAGGVRKLYQRLRSRNACKTCALGMGGQQGGMVNEQGRFPEVCKKSVQAQVGDMAGVIDEAFFERTTLEEMATFDSHRMESLGRLAFPIVAEPGDSHYRRIGWDEALDRAGAALRDAPPDETFFYGSGRSSNEASFLYQLIARAYGTQNIHNCSYYCHSASGVALQQVYGSGTASILLDDLEQADFTMIVGANPASNHPRLLTLLVKMRRAGGKVVIVNPLRELGLCRFRVPSDWRSMTFGSDVNDLYVQPHIGGDIPFLKGVLKAFVAAGGVDRAFVDAHTNGWADVEADVNAAGWDELEKTSGVPRAEMEQVAQMIRDGKRGIFLWAMGLTHHTFGVDNILALSNIALARGWLGKPGCGLLPIRGHSNVQGVGSVGVSPTVKDAFAAAMEEAYDITVPRTGGQHTFASMEAAIDGKIQAAVLLGGNLYSSNPDLDWAERALRRIPFTLGITTKLNPGHVVGRGQTSIVVPVLARDEEQQTTTQESMFNFVRLSDGGPPALEGEFRSEVDVVASLAERILPEGKFDWTRFRSHEALREEIARVVPGYGAIADMGKPTSGPDGGEFQIQGRTFHEPRFATPDGQAHFAVTPVPDLGDASNTYRMMTLRSEGQFNTVVYEVEDLYRGNMRRDVVMMAADDAKRRNFVEGTRVRVSNETGQMDVTVAIVDIRAGNVAMYFPEANILVPGRIDSRSKTPAFKSIPVQIEPIE